MPVTEIKNFWERLMDRIEDRFDAFIEESWRIPFPIIFVLSLIMFILATILAIIRLISVL